MVTAFNTINIGAFLYKELFICFYPLKHLKSSNDNGPTCNGTALMEHKSSASSHNMSQQLCCDIFNLVQAKSSLEHPLESKRSNMKVAENQYWHLPSPCTIYITLSKLNCFFLIFLIFWLLKSCLCNVSKMQQNCFSAGKVVAVSTKNQNKAGFWVGFVQTPLWSKLCIYIATARSHDNTTDCTPPPARPLLKSVSPKF